MTSSNDVIYFTFICTKDEQVNEIEMISRAAWLYYKEGLTQEEIGRKLRLSRIKIVRLLDKAKDRGIIKIQILSGGICFSIEQKLKETLSLNEVVVAPRGAKSPLDTVGQAAAQFLEDRLRDNDLIGTGWGVTIAKVASHLTGAQAKDIRLVAMAGGWASSPFVDPYYIVGSMAAKLHARCYYIVAPAMAESEEVALQYRSNPMVDEVFRMIPLANMAIVSVGGVSAQSTIVRTNWISEVESEMVRRQGAVGVMLGQFFDAKGGLLDLPQHKRNISLSIAELKKIPSVIGVACGDEKVSAIVGACRGGYIKTLITDEETAEKVLAHVATASPGKVPINS